MVWANFIQILRVLKISDTMIHFFLQRNRLVMTVAIQYRELYDLHAALLAKLPWIEVSTGLNVAGEFVCNSEVM